MAFLFESLLVYQKALAFSKETLLLSSNPPRGYSALIDQWRRAAMSIPANLAEGSGRKHANDRKQFFWIARGSVNECVPFVELAQAASIVSPEDAAQCRRKLEELGRMITGLIRANTASERRNGS